jgi:hypothetical protein
MPIHDWTRVRPGIFHAFHQVWIGTLQGVLNSKQLPPDYYALVEPATGKGKVDFAALRSESNRFANKSEADFYATKANALAIRYGGTDRVVAVLQVISSGNKSGQLSLQSFVKKATVMLNQGINLMIVDLYPPSPNDPNGIHAAIWSELGIGSFGPPTESRLTLAAYASDSGLNAYVEPTAVGRPLADMPLFLNSEEYVNIPLEETYMEALQGMPDHYLKILEGGSE